MNFDKFYRNPDERTKWERFRKSIKIEIEMVSWNGLHLESTIFIFSAVNLDKFHRNPDERTKIRAFQSQQFFCRSSMLSWKKNGGRSSHHLHEKTIASLLIASFWSAVNHNTSLHHCGFIHHRVCNHLQTFICHHSSSWGTETEANTAAAESTSMAFSSFPIWAKGIGEQDFVKAFFTFGFVETGP